MVATRRGKKSSAEGKSSSTSEISEVEVAGEPTPAFQALSPPQFSILVCMSLAFTHVIDLAKSIQSTNGILNTGIIATENITAIPTNATAYCVRHFQNVTDIQADLNNEEAIIAELGCTPADLQLLNLRYQTTIIRISISLITTMLCWGNTPLLKSWAYAYSIFVMIMLGGLIMQKEFLKGGEKFSLGVMLILMLISNRRERQGRLRFDLDAGLFNLVLFSLVVLMSIIISTHMILGVEEITNLSLEDVTPGGLATWYMTVIVEYSILTVVGCFALFFFDEGRKRGLLILMSFVVVYHAFIQIPSQRDFWLDAKGRQTFVMLIFACLLAGGLMPSFDKFVIKK